MQLIIHTENDLKKLQGKFILQVSSHEPDRTLMEYKWEFAKEKRLFIISGLGYIDLFGDRKDFNSFEDFKNFFNLYLYKHKIERGESGGERFHRLLTSSELAYLFEKIKNENY